MRYSVEVRRFDVLVDCYDTDHLVKAMMDVRKGYEVKVYDTVNFDEYILNNEVDA